MVSRFTPGRNISSRETVSVRNRFGGEVSSSDNTTTNSQHHEDLEEAVHGSNKMNGKFLIIFTAIWLWHRKLEKQEAEGHLSYEGNVILNQRTAREYVGKM